MVILYLLICLCSTLVNNRNIYFNIGKINSGDSHIVNGDIVTLNNPDNYYIQTNSFNKSVIVNASCTIYLSGSSLMNNNSTLTPFIIEESKEVDIYLNNRITIIDSLLNEKGAIIYLKKGANLRIKNDCCGGNYGLILFSNSLYAIKGEEDTTLSIDNCYLKIVSISINSGGIFIPKSIFFENEPSFYYKSISGNKPAIESRGQIWFANGNYDITSLEGKGIVSKSILTFGQYRKNICVNMNIKTSLEAIEAKGLDIFCGNINIQSKGNGIMVEDKSENINCYSNITSYIKLYDGKININSYNHGIYTSGDILIFDGFLLVNSYSNNNKDLIVFQGVLKNMGGIILVYSNDTNNLIEITSKQKSQQYIQHIDFNSYLRVYRNGDEIISIKLIKDIEYIFFNYPDNDDNYILKIDGNEIIPIVRTLLTNDVEEHSTENSILHNNVNDNKEIVNNNLKSTNIISNNDIDSSNDKEIVNHQKLTENISTKSIESDNEKESLSEETMKVSIKSTNLKRIKL